MVVSCCGWQKGTSQDEATLNSEEIKPVTLSSYACLKTLVIQSVSRKFCQIFKISYQLGGRVYG